MTVTLSEVSQQTVDTHVHWWGGGGGGGDRGLYFVGFMHGLTLLINSF